MLPAAAKKHDPGGALAFAFYYYAGFDWSYATNDPYLLNALAASSCTSCQSAATGISQVVAKGGTISGGRCAVSKASVDLRRYRVPFKYEVAVRVTLTEEPITVHYPGAAPSTAAPALTHYAAVLFTVWTPDGWRTADTGSAR